MINKHLLMTSAFINDARKLKYPVKIREDDYKESFKLARNYSNRFKTITILETLAKNGVDYLEESGFPIVYSTFDNHYGNKGRSWMNHLYEFLIRNNDINDEDFVVFLAGRYRIINDNLINYIDNLGNEFKMFAKSSDDLYPHIQNNPGVHTFYIAFTKKIFSDFFEWYHINSAEIKKNKITSIEWEVKSFMKTRSDCKIFGKDTIIGVQSNIFYPGNWIRRLV